MNTFGNLTMLLTALNSLLAVLFNISYFWSSFFPKGIFLIRTLSSSKNFVFPSSRTLFIVITLFSLVNFHFTWFFHSMILPMITRKNRISHQLSPILFYENVIRYCGTIMYFLRTYNKHIRNIRLKVTMVMNHWKTLDINQRNIKGN